MVKTNSSNIDHNLKYERYTASGYKDNINTVFTSSKSILPRKYLKRQLI